MQCLRQSADPREESAGNRLRLQACASRAPGRRGGRKFALSKAHVRLALAAMANRDTSVAALAAERGVKPVTLGVTTRKCPDCPVQVNIRGTHAASKDGFSRSGRGPDTDAAVQI